MPRWLWRTALVCLFFALAAYAYAPIARAGLLARDLSYLVDASRSAWPEDLDRGSESSIDLAWGAHGERRPLASFALALSSRLWSERGAWTPLALERMRAENLALLLLTAFALGLCVRRVLLPWLGSDAAGAAAWASALILACHPLCAWPVAHAASRGDLLAAFLACASIVLFLRARQEREFAAIVVSAVLAALCGFTSDAAWFLPVTLCVLELTSARRYRTLKVRARTAATTLVVFGACVALERFAAAAMRAPEAAQGWWNDVASLRTPSAIETVVEKLACIVLPVPPGWSGPAGLVLAGAIMLAAFHPALVAARSAPRTWAWLGVGLCVALVACALRRTDVRVAPRDYTAAELLFPGAIAMSAALGVTLSALSDVRRVALPLCAVVACTLLARASSSTFAAQSAPLESLRADLSHARLLYGADARILVVDAPERIPAASNTSDVVERAQALDAAALAVAVPLLVDPAIAPVDPVIASFGPASARTDSAASPKDAAASRAGGTPRCASWARAITLSALFALAREPEFHEMRRGKLALLMDESLLGAADAVAGRRIASMLPAPDATIEKIFWRQQARSPLLDFDPWESRCVRVVALPTTDTGSRPRLDWRASAEGLEMRARDGVWIAGAEGPIAIFDLAREIEWLCGKRIKRLSFAQGAANLVQSEVLDDVPPFAEDATPRTRGDDWVMSLRADLAPRPLAGEGRWTLSLLALEPFEFAEIRAAPPRGNETVFSGAAAWERRVRAESGGAIAWTLTYRVGDTDVVRRSGRK